MKQEHGVTLIELVIVLAIVGLLTYMAVPAYTQFVMKSKRTQATSTLMNIQLAQEKYRTNNATYGTLAQVWGGVTATENGDYTLAINNNTATGFTATATAVGGQVNDAEQGTACSPLVLTVNGAATTRTPAVCW